MPFKAGDPNNPGYKPGESGNPAGRQRGSRNKLATTFIDDLYSDYKAHGRDAIETVRAQHPETYVKIVASLLPKEVAISTPASDLSDEQLADAIAALTGAIAADIDGIESGAGSSESGEPASGLPAIH